jgi:NADPH2:quinone reductase
MSTIVKLLADGAIKPAIGARLKLDQAAQAHTLVERGVAMGKAVLVP